MTDVVGFCQMKDEADVADHVVLHMLEEGLDHVVVADNASIDGTRDLLAELAAEYPVTVVDDPVVAYYQADKMTALVHRYAADHGADMWCVPFDADELWLAPDRVGRWLRSRPAEIRHVGAVLYNHHPTEADPPGDNPFETIVWRMIEPGALPKVAFRYSPGVSVAMGNHSVSFTDGPIVPIVDGLSIRHFSHRSYSQFRHKVIVGARAYAASNLAPEFGAHWRSYAQILANGGDEALRAVFERWFFHLSPVDEGLIHDPAPFRRWRG